MSIKAVILCGGSGSRLWPESRESLPKQFIPIFEGKTLLDLTIERILNIQNQKKPIIICNKKHGFLVKKSLKKFNLKADIILEPEGKNTTAAIYLAAKSSPKNANLLIMPSDHLISDKEIFIEDISNITRILTSKHWFTLGVKPNKPSEAYGYIKVSREKENNNNLLKVIHFIEKPKKEIAVKFINDDNYFWNSGIFIGKASMIISSIKEHAPDITKKCDEVFDKRTINKKTSEINFLPHLFSTIPSQSIDYSVMEREKNIYLYPLNIKWSDVGSWDAIAEINQKNTTPKNIIEIDSKDNFVRSKKRVIATIGVKDLIIIDSDNATLITKKNHSEKVKLIVNKLIERGFNETKENSFEDRPWGQFQILLDNDHCKVKKIEINPKSRLSLQFHNFRSEHWLVVYGQAHIYLDGINTTMGPGESIDIPVKSQHYIENKSSNKLVIIETQLGSYFGEDDIIRIDDPYSR